MNFSQQAAALIVRDHGDSLRRALDAIFGQYTPSPDQDWLDSAITTRGVAERLPEIWNQLNDEVKMAFINATLPNGRSKTGGVARGAIARQSKDWVNYFVQTTLANALEMVMTEDERSKNVALSMLIAPHFHAGGLGAAIIADVNRLKAGYVSEVSGDPRVKRLIDLIV